MFKSKKDKHRQLQPSPSVNEAEMALDEFVPQSTPFYQDVDRTTEEIMEDEHFERCCRHRGYSLDRVQFKIRANVRKAMKKVKANLQDIEGIFASIEEAKSNSGCDDEVKVLVDGQAVIPAQEAGWNARRHMNEIWTLRSCVEQIKQLQSERQVMMDQGRSAKDLDIGLRDRTREAKQSLKALRDYRDRQTWLVEHYTNALRSGQDVDVQVDTW